MMENTVQTISFRRYYFRQIITNTVMGLLYTSMTLYERSAFSEAHRGLTLAIWGVFIVLTFLTITLSTVTAARHDKFDGLYRENVSRTNSAFLFLLFVLGFVLFLAATCVRGLGVPVYRISGGMIAAGMYFLYAVYNGIAMHYEQSSAEAGEDA